jgi:hypothetical protein
MTSDLFHTVPVAMTQHHHQQRRTITLPDPHMAALETIAREHFNGNVSAALRELIATHPVTKSLVPSSPLATAGV